MANALTFAQIVYRDLDTVSWWFAQGAIGPELAQEYVDAWNATPGRFTRAYLTDTGDGIATVPAGEEGRT